LASSVTPTGALWSKPGVVGVCAEAVAVPLRLKPSAIPAVPKNREQRRRVKIDRGMDTPPGAGRPSIVVISTRTPASEGRCETRQRSRGTSTRDAWLPKLGLTLSVTKVFTITLPSAEGNDS
jgi:hypothetical protein